MADNKTLAKRKEKLIGQLSMVWLLVLDFIEKYVEENRRLYYNIEDGLTCETYYIEAEGEQCKVFIDMGKFNADIYRCDLEDLDWNELKEIMKQAKC